MKRDRQYGSWLDSTMMLQGMMFDIYERQLNKVANDVSFSYFELLLTNEG